MSESPLTTLASVINQDTVPPGKLKAFPPQPPCSPRKSVGYNAPASRELLPGYTGWSVPLMEVLCGQSNLFTNMCVFGNAKNAGCAEAALSDGCIFLAEGMNLTWTDMLQGW